MLETGVSFLSMLEVMAVEFIRLLMLVLVLNGSV